MLQSRSVVAFLCARSLVAASPRAVAEEEDDELGPAAARRDDPRGRAALPAKARLAALKRDGSEAVSKTDFAVGQLVIAR